MKPNPLKPRKNVVPPNAFSFYVNLYCSRQGYKLYSSNVAEATKSWLSLNESEKQQVETKFEECKQRYRSHIFNQLKNAEPFMKIKNTRVRKSQSSVNDSPGKRNEDETKECVPIIESEKEELIESYEQSTEQYDSKEQSPLSTESPNGDNNEQNENIMEFTTTNNEPQRTLIEPLPPSVKTGHELFCMLTSADQSSNLTWSSLPQFEKNQYSRAVSLLKKITYLSTGNIYRA